MKPDIRLVRAVHPQIRRASLRTGRSGCITQTGGRHGRRKNIRHSAFYGWAPASNAGSPCVEFPWSAAIIMSGWCQLYPGPGCLAAPRAERHNCQGWAGRTLAGPGEPGDGGAGERDLRDVVAAPTVAGQSRSRTRICMPVTTTPSPPSRLTSCSSRRLASCRDWFTSSVQPATSTLPDHRRAWPASPRSSCRHPIEMPSARPACTHPAVISLAKSCPETSQVKSPRCPCAAPGAVTETSSGTPDPLRAPCAGRWRWRRTWFCPASRGSRSSGPPRNPDQAAGANRSAADAPIPADLGDHDPHRGQCARTGAPAGVVSCCRMSAARCSRMPVTHCELWL